MISLRNISAPFACPADAQSPKLSLAIDSWLDDKRMEFLQTQDNPAMDVFRRRSAVVGFRAGMICWALEGRMSKEGVDFALWVANYMLHNLLDLFGEAMNKAMESESVMPTASKTQNILASLPKEFGKAEVLALSQTAKVKTPVKILIHRWKKAGLVTPLEQNRWEKI